MKKILWLLFNIIDLFIFLVLDFFIGGFFLFLDNFNFDGFDFMSETSDLGIFISGTMGVKENKMINKNTYKIKYYTKLFETVLSEILENEFIKIQDHLLKSSEKKGEKYFQYANPKGQEHEEIVFKKLFGGKFRILKLGEICFVFDLNNYAIENLNTFTENFSKSSKEVNAKIPEIIKDILNDNGKGLELIILVDEKSKLNDFSINLCDEETKICSSAFLNDLNKWDYFAKIFN